MPATLLAVPPRAATVCGAPASRGVAGFDALEREGEGHTNRAAVALANKLARIAWAVWRHERRFDGDHALQLAAAA